MSDTDTEADVIHYVVPLGDDLRLRDDGALLRYATRVMDEECAKRGRVRISDITHRDSTGPTGISARNYRALTAAGAPSVASP
jgi:hypothetical protein